ncbi:hypothetical protein FOZ60_016310 [Perkinsus olseni]|uniref:Sphingomyelin synthase-like domain-containing protein n=1 Tax=Perkinsus olseni TaxID=32597 RepID=A0A7J6P4Q1_PEROL|nr:hypothetical protein FOZ60_016310 [Perkinsus olseni]
MSPSDLPQDRHRDESVLVLRPVTEDGGLGVTDNNACVPELASPTVEESKTDLREQAPRKRSCWERMKAIWRARIDYIKEAWPLEWAVLKKGAWWVCQGRRDSDKGCFSVTALIRDQAIQSMIFPFEWFGTGLVDAAVAPGDVTNYLSLILGVGYVLRPLFFPFPHRAMNMLWRWGVVASLATYARLITFMVTLLPGSAQHCAEEEFNPPADWGVILTRLFTSGGCSDLIFSGHMMYTIIVTCGIFRYSRNMYLKIFLLLLTILQGFLIVASRSHYSVDVVVAAYAVPCMWVTFAHFVPNDFRLDDESIPSPGVSDDEEEGAAEGYHTAAPSPGTGSGSSQHQKISSANLHSPQVADEAFGGGLGYFECLSEGLACDYLIEALELAPAGVFTSPFIEPLVQTLDDGKSISTGMELYGKEGTDYMVLQLRSSYRRKRLLGQALSRWIAKSGFSKVLAVSSMSSHVQDDSDLEVNTPLRVFRSQETFGLPTIDKERIVGGGLITRLDDDIPGLLCFAKGTDVEKLPLARIVAEFLMTNVCNFPEAPTDVEPASWRAIQESSGYGRYDDEDDLRRINSLSADGSGRDGNLFLDQGFRGGKLNTHNTVPHVACPSGGTSADGHINSTSLVIGRANSDEVWNFSSTRPNEAFVHFGGRSKSDGSKVPAEASCRGGELEFSDPSKLEEMLPWSASIDMRTGQWKGVDRSEDPPFSRRVGLHAAAGPKPSEEVANVPEAAPPNDGASTPGRPAVFERHGFIFDEYKRHQYHGYARNNHGGLWKCESHTELLLSAAAGACTVGCGAAATVASGTAAAVMTGGSIGVAAVSLAASAGYTVWKYIFSEEGEDESAHAGAIELYKPLLTKEDRLEASQTSTAQDSEVDEAKGRLQFSMKFGHASVD